MPCFQVEHCEELKTVLTFLSLADKAATEVEDSVLQAFHGVVMHTLQRRYKQLISMSKVV